LRVGIISGLPATAGKQPDGWLADDRAIMLAQFVEQMGLSIAG
jgi:hypothetical protein